MLKQACVVCKIVGAIAIIGALSWGSLALFQVNPIRYILGSTVARLFFALVGLSGILLLVSYFYVCPACKKIQRA